ncbi:MAG: hypothetical protein GY830_03620 [Bacteroidetes bacterium]|nr:hypothetical protein [Bacteroidota bacterium]
MKQVYSNSIPTKIEFDIPDKYLLKTKNSLNDIEFDEKLDNLLFNRKTNKIVKDKTEFLINENARKLSSFFKDNYFFNLDDESKKHF